MTEKRSCFLHGDHEEEQCPKCPKSASASPNLVTLLREGAEIERLRAALEMLYDKWENGDQCYETFSGGLGNAFNLTADEENAVLALIRRRPENWREPIPHETGNYSQAYADQMRQALLRISLGPDDELPNSEVAAWAASIAHHGLLCSAVKATVLRACTCTQEPFARDVNCPVHRETKEPWEFDRYVRGQLKAEGIKITRADTFEQAMLKALELAQPHDVLVLRAPSQQEAAGIANMWQCGSCRTFNPVLDQKCQKCGQLKAIECLCTPDRVAGFCPVHGATESQRQ